MGGVTHPFFIFKMSETLGDEETLGTVLSYPKKS